MSSTRLLRTSCVAWVFRLVFSMWLRIASPPYLWWVNVVGLPVSLLCHHCA